MYGVPLTAFSFCHILNDKIMSGCQRGSVTLTEVHFKSSCNDLKKISRK